MAGVSSIWNDIQLKFKTGDKVIQLIFINVGVFLLVNLVGLFLIIIQGYEVGATSLNTFLTWFEGSSDWKHNLTKPWVLITYMFLHEGVWHILWNMLFLFWFGGIVKSFGGNHRILPLYILGGLAGFVIYFLSANFLPEAFSQHLGGYILGASAGVMAIVIAAATLAPEYSIHVLFIGPVRLKYIALVVILLDFIGIRSGGNTGGHLAHLGGAFLGWLYISQMRNGKDWTPYINDIFSKIGAFFQPLLNIFSNERPKPKVAYKNPNQPNRSSDSKINVSQQERIDSILDKIKRSGYDSLTEEEKGFLFRVSKEK